MAILQWLLGKLANSASTLLNALFGWAVLALFGQTSPREKTLLTGLVAAAAAWPVLVLGAVVPKLAAKVLVFVPLPPSVPKYAISLVWIFLALAVPIAVGIVFALRAPPGTPQEPSWKRVLRGIPITLGVAGSFWMMLAIAPVVRLISVVRRLTDEHLSLMPLPGHYEEVASELAKGLVKHGIAIERVAPPWWLTAPSRVLVKLGGAALRGYAVKDVACYKGPKVQLVFYPSDLLIRGEAKTTALVHSLMAEHLAELPAYETLDSHSQALEAELKGIWRALELDPEAHVGSSVLTSRLEEVAHKLTDLRLPFAEWEIVYRQLLQLGRALNGSAPLLSVEAKAKVAPAAAQELKDKKPEKEAVMTHPASSNPELANWSTAHLFKQIAVETKELAIKEVALAREELREDLKHELAAAKGLGVAGLLGLGAFNALLTTGILALSLVWPGWLAGLVVTGALALIAAALGAWSWAQRTKLPLQRTRHTLEEDLQWAKNRMA